MPRIVFVVIPSWFHTKLTVGVAAVSNASDLNRIFRDLIEQDAIVAAAESQAHERRFELFHISAAAKEKSVDAVQH